MYTKYIVVSSEKAKTLYNNNSINKRTINKRQPEVQFQIIYFT